MPPPYSSPSSAACTDEDVLLQAQSFRTRDLQSLDSEHDVFEVYSARHTLAQDLEPFPPMLDTPPAGSGEADDLGVTYDACDGSNGVDFKEERTEALLSHPTVLPGQLTYPKSSYAFHVPPLPVTSEEAAICALNQERTRLDEETALKGSPGKDLDWECFELSEFSIYLPRDQSYALEMRGLQNLGRVSQGSYLFDGILSMGCVRHYVQGVPFEICSIDNYGEDVDTVGDGLFLLSAANAKEGRLFYRLQRPSSEYRRFHQDFVWFADLAKHFVDFARSRLALEKVVSVFNFRADFSAWLRTTHRNSTKVAQWMAQHKGSDFRQAVSASVEFLYKEAHGLDREAFHDLQIWHELLWRDHVPQQALKEKMTIVTPYIYDCFGHMKFGHNLKAVEPNATGTFSSCTDNPQRLAKTSLLPVKPGVTPRSSKSKKASLPKLFERNQLIDSIQVGDVISVPMDACNVRVWKDEGSRWKAADEYWYLLVGAVYRGSNGKRSFDGLWLSAPSDTSCAMMKYPWANELFLSEICTCIDSKLGAYSEDEVLDKHVVKWHGDPRITKSLVVRQTYLHSDQFVTLQDSHKQCAHRKTADASALEPEQYRVGTTLLVTSSPERSTHEMEAYEVMAYVREDLGRFVVLRRLLRRAEMEKGGEARPNELVYSDYTDKVLATKLHDPDLTKPCFVRIYTQEEADQKAVPAPYNRDGTGNAFYITQRLVGNDLLRIQDNMPRSLIQGFDPSQPSTLQKLAGLDLFCGGGNFGRGIEEGGAVENQYAADIWSPAIHTYYANQKLSGNTGLYLGSVDDLLLAAMQGNPDRLEQVPLPGEVDIILAGSPCQGFSLMNNRIKQDDHRNTGKGLKNQSLVASVAAYIDFYRPKYGVLENVLNMAQKGPARDNDVLSQLICAIVGMGYQVQLFLIDAWSCGSSQSRSRIFVTFVAPNLPPLDAPALSHSHPDGVLMRALGTLANGKSFCNREHGPTPFHHRTVADATHDLPAINDGATHACTSHPDHVLPTGVSRERGLQIKAIPKRPYGMNFAKAWMQGQGTMSAPQRSLFPSVTVWGRAPGQETQSTQVRSRAWGRINPSGLFPNMCVRVSESDARMGTILHWNEDRRISILESRRAQNFLDDDVLVGTRSDQTKLIGNSVDRKVAQTLGLAIRKAWAKSRQDVLSDGSMQDILANRPCQIADSITRDRIETIMPTPVLPFKLSDLLLSDSEARRRVDSAAALNGSGSPSGSSSDKTDFRGFSDNDEIAAMVEKSLGGKRKLSGVDDTEKAAKQRQRPSCNSAGQMVQVAMSVNGASDDCNDAERAG